MNKLVADALLRFFGRTVENRKTEGVTQLAGSLTELFNRDAQSQGRPRPRIIVPNNNDSLR